MTTYAVLGMTEENIALDVTAELIDVPGIDDVTVDLGTATIEVAGSVPRERIRQAVRVAGCDLAD